LTEERLPYWAEKNPEGEGYIVNIEKLLFSICLSELCVVEMLHNVDAEGNRIPRDTLIEIWEAEILNLRKCKYMDVVRTNYYTFFCKKDDTRETFGNRWRAAHESTKYLFTVNLEEAWMHITDPLRYSIKTRNETHLFFNKPELTPEEIRVILEGAYKQAVDEA